MSSFIDRANIFFVVEAIPFIGNDYFHFSGVKEDSTVIRFLEFIRLFVDPLESEYKFHLLEILIFLQR